MTGEVLQKAIDLGKAIVESEEYKKLKEAETKLLNNEKTVLLFQDYKQLQAELLYGNANEEVKKKLQEVEEKLMNTEEGKAYFEAFRNFQALLESVNSIINQMIATGGNIGCSGNCGSCGMHG